MNSPVFRVGIVGAGSIARRAHIPGWQALPGVEVAAICDIDPLAAATAAGEFNIQQVFTDARDLLALPLNAVSVCVHNAAHVPLAGAALESGKHVLCEKPLAITALEAKVLGEKADAVKRVLMTQHQLRFSKPALAARAWVDAGKVGPVYHAEVKALRRAMAPTSAGFIDKTLAGGGPALDIGVHSLDIALWLMGFPRAVRVSGTVKKNFAHGPHFSVEDFAAGFVHFENGATLTLECSWMGHHPEETLNCRLLGLNGSLHWPSGEFFHGAWQEPLAQIIPSALPEGNPHFEAIRAFYEAVRAGEASPVPWRETYEVIAIMEALYKSAAEGREIPIPAL